MYGAMDLDPSMVKALQSLWMNHAPSK
ncbi:hypothetical protein A2U01_0076210, partial [Trifolium medium]|nr:hypothetical protein [Trifolium medium]